MDTETATDASTADKSNHKQQLQQQQKASASKDTSSVTGSELVIEPKAEYDDEANDETVEDLTLDEEDMGMDDLDHNAGTSQGGEGSSQGRLKCYISCFFYVFMGVEMFFFLVDMESNIRKLEGIFLLTFNIRDFPSY